MSLVATEKLLKSKNAIRKPQDLLQFPLLSFGPEAGSSQHWRLQNGSKRENLKVKPLITSNHAQSILELTKASLGLALIPRVVCLKALHDKSIREVLPDWCMDQAPIHLLMPSSKNPAPKIRAVVDHLAEAVSRALN